ncbi:MAG: transposase family protein [Gammaproteobacteria bacterium]|nr:transposase family protein [Gammaproteobacteria bacterium]
MIVAGREQTLHAFHMVLSHSRFDAIVWMTSEDQLSWLSGHNGAFTRLGGIPAVVRVDNTKTAVVHGAGAWGELNASYRAYARAVRFHIDPCAPYSPEHKGKVERAVRTQRFGRSRPSGPGTAWKSCRCALTRRSSTRPAGGAARRPAPRCGRPGTPSASGSRRCRSCPCRSITSPPVAWPATRWSPSRVTSTRSRSPTSAARSRYAVAPDACR